MTATVTDTCPPTDGRGVDARHSERDPCDDAGGHVRAPIERTARAIERGPQPTRIADCCFARAARAARSDRHLHWFAFATASMRGRRCCSQVTQEGCARVWRTWPILPRQYASRGAEDGACRVRIECGGRFVGLNTRNIDPVCLSVCPHVSSCFAVSEKKSWPMPTLCRPARTHLLDGCAGSTRSGCTDNSVGASAKNVVFIHFQCRERAHASKVTAALSRNGKQGRIIASFDQDTSHSPCARRRRR